MSTRALALRFQDAGPAQAARYVVSLRESLNDAAGPAPGDPRPDDTLTMALGTDNPDAQGLETAIILHSIADGVTAGLIVGFAHVVAESAGKRLAKRMLVEQLLGWWYRNGQPPMHLETDSGEKQVLTPATPDPSKVLGSLVEKVST